MKVERKSKEFTPVTITLESQLEVDALYVIIGRSASGGSGVDTNAWYRSIVEFVSDPDSPLVKATEPRYTSIGLRLEKNDAA